MSTFLPPTAIISRMSHKTADAPKVAPSSAKKTWAVVTALLIVISVSAKLWQAYQPEPQIDPELAEAQRILKDLIERSESPVKGEITDEALLLLKGHTGEVLGAVFSPDGTKIASASADKSIKLWDAKTGSELLTLNGHTESVRCVAFSPDSKRVASGSEDNMVKMWDVASGRVVHNLKGHKEGWVFGVTFNPDGTRVASAGFKSAKLWDAVRGVEILTLKGHSQKSVTARPARDFVRAVIWEI